MGDKKMFYRYCIVPKCKNTIRNAPHKMYFNFPRDANIRKKWCKAMKRGEVSSKSCLYICEDHFNIEEDTENYIQYKIMALQEGHRMTLRLKKGVVPHIFHCQTTNNLKPPPERKAAIKRNRLALVEEALAEYARRQCVTTQKTSNLQKDFSKSAPTASHMKIHTEIKIEYVDDPNFSSNVSHEYVLQIDKPVADNSNNINKLSKPKAVDFKKNRPSRFFNSNHNKKRNLFSETPVDTILSSVESSSNRKIEMLPNNSVDILSTTATSSDNSVDIASTTPTPSEPVPNSIIKTEMSHDNVDIVSAIAPSESIPNLRVKTEMFFDNSVVNIVSTPATLTPYSIKTELLSDDSVDILSPTVTSSESTAPCSIKTELFSDNSVGIMSNIASSSELTALSRIKTKMSSDNSVDIVSTPAISESTPTSTIKREFLTATATTFDLIPISSIKREIISDNSVDIITNMSPQSAITSRIKIELVSEDDNYGPDCDSESRWLLEDDLDNEKQLNNLISSGMIQLI